MTKAGVTQSPLFNWMSSNHQNRRNIKIPLRKLFDEMALGEKERERSSMAFEQFYEQFKNYVYTVCKDFLSTRGIDDKDHLGSFFNNVFVTILQKSEKLKVPDTVPDSEVKYVICSIIGKFIKFEGLQYLRELDSNNSVEIEFIEVYNEDVEENLTGNEGESIPLATLNKALGTLNEQTRLILLECFRYHDENKNIPSKVLDELEQHFGKSRQALRKIKSRALKEIKEIVLNSDNIEITKKTRHG